MPPAVSDCLACARRGNRAFLNMQEQGILFNGALWLYAVFVSAEAASALGFAYMVLRSLYPIIWMLLGGEAGAPEQLSMTTFPQYAINLYMAVATMMKIKGMGDLDDLFFGYKSLGVFAFTVAFMAYAVGLIASLNETTFSGFFGKKK